MTDFYTESGKYRTERQAEKERERVRESEVGSERATLLPVTLTDITPAAE